MLAATWMDPVIGLDVHLVMVPTPAGPIPTPLPNPFVGIVFNAFELAFNMLPEAAEVIAGVADSVTGAGADGEHGAVGAGIVATVNAVTEKLSGGMAKAMWALNPVNTALEYVSGQLRGSAEANAGKVKVNGLWAAIGGGTAKALPPHLPLGGPLAPPPGNSADLYFGGLGVFFEGHAPVRLLDLAVSCGFPVPAPTSMVMAIPKGNPVLVMRPPAPDLVSLLSNVLGSKLRAAGRFGLARAARLHKALGRTKMIQALRDGSKRLANRILGPKRAAPIRKAICILTGEPVDVATGRVLTTVQEFELPGPIPLVFERSYDSALSWRDGTLGHGWSHSLDQAVWEERGRVVLKEEDGREVEFSTLGLPQHRLPVGRSVWNPMDRTRLTRRAVERWEVTSPDGHVREFESAGSGRARLTHIRDRVGIHAIELAYDYRGRLEQVRDSAGRLVRFEYDRDSHMSAIKLPTPDGAGWYTHSKFEYDRHGDLVRAEDAVGNALAYAYSNHLIVRKTDRTGLTFFYQYDDNDHTAKCVRTWGDRGIYHRVLSFLTQKRTTIVEDSYGRPTTYVIGETGLVASVTDPIGATTTYEHDPATGWLLRTTDPMGAVTSWEYDERGNCTAIVEPDGARTKITWEGDHPVLVEEPNSARWEYTWNRAGQFTALRDPLGFVTTYEWEKGLLKRITRPGGATTTIEHDEWRQPVRVVLPNGGETRLHYDGHGRLVRIRNALGGTEKIRYDTLGREVVRRSATGEWTTLSYDAEDNIVGVRDATRHIRFGYGGFHKVTWREEAGTRVTYDIDLDDRLTAVINEAGERYSFELDSRGLVTAEVEFDGTTRRYLRDKGGRVTDVELPSRLRSKRTYDVAGRLLEIAHDDGCFVRFAYDAAGQLALAENESATVELERDLLGRVTVEHVNGNEVRSRYAHDGRRSEMTTSLGARVEIRRDALGNAEQLFFGDSRFRDEPDVRFERDLLGFERASRFAGGIGVEWTRDLAGRPLARRTYARGSASAGRDEVDTRAYQWRSGNQIAAIIGTSTGPTFYDYDARGRLIRERRRDGVLERAMDAAGNVYRTGDGRDRRYGKGGRLERDEVHDFEHDADGNQIKKTGTDGVWRYAWNGHGLMKSVSRPDGTCLAFEYDAFARRIAKRVVGPDGSMRRETSFIWDGNVVAHEQDSEQGLVTWRFQPETFTPIAKEQDGRRWSIATDHLGTPTEMYDEAGQLAWRMQLDAFGVGRRDVALCKCPWRWSGQYADEETSLYYNRFRYYDSASGAYVSPDPIGLAGGLNLRGYVHNPLSWVDPLGLSKKSRDYLSDDEFEILAQKTFGGSSGRLPLSKPRPSGATDVEIDLISNDTLTQIKRVTSPEATFGGNNKEQFEMTVDAALISERSRIRYIVASEAPERYIQDIRLMPLPDGIQLIIERLPARK